MIDQRRTLVRARDLAGFRAAVADLALTGPALSRRRRAVIVPTRASAELLRQTLERHDFERDDLGDRQGSLRGLVLPNLLTRDEWLARLADALPGAPPLASRLEREVLLERAARRTAERRRLGGAPFRLRPGLVAEMLDLYDELGRRQRTIRRFARALFDQLRVERGTDRGSEGLIRQTAFLALTFLAYERGLDASGAIDEHVLRARLIATQPALPINHLIVAVADHPSDPRGLWPADFDLAGRLRGLVRIDVVMTDETHDAGFRERLERELPGIEETRREGASQDTRLVRPAGDDPDACVFVSRDREEELRQVARAIRARAVATSHQLAAPLAVVFHRPLPYLYLAQQVLTDARIPYQAFDAQPLAAEPYAALLDVVLAVARTGGTRESVVALLRSMMLRLEENGEPVTAIDVAMLDAVLSERRVTAEADAYAPAVELHFQGRDTRGRFSRTGALRAARVAAAVREELAPYRSAETASAQVRAVSRFLRRHERPLLPGEEWHERHGRARAAVLGVLDELADALQRHDDGARGHDAITAAIRHAVEARTFSPRRGTGGVHLVDAVAARFGRFDHVHLVGLVETDWPERPRRSIFYTSGMLKALGWPQEPDQMRAQQAAFRDLLRLATGTTTLHAFQLEADGIVARSPMVDAARDLPTVAGEAIAAPLPRIFADEVLTEDAARESDLEPAMSEWLALRRARPGLDDPRYRGYVDPVAPHAYRVSRVDRYVDCPFKYFSETVLGLPEEREEEAGLTPLERGQLIHELFERFYGAWQQQGHGAITPATFPEAVALFTRLTQDALARLPEGDRALEETRLLGSIVSRGVAERVFELESDAGGTIVKRLLEVDLRGPFLFPQLHGLKQKTVEIRGKADRIDVFADGSLRVVDYKLSKLPDLDTSIQLAVYAHAARQMLEARDGRIHNVGSAMYLAFGDDRRLDGRLGTADEPAFLAVEARASAFATTTDDIEAGRFPPKPLRPNECAWCRYAGVCRKEYQIEDDEAAESV
jgi:RecB family exonuclease